MTVNYTTNLALGQPVTGTESGTWGDDVNNSVTSYLDIAIAGGLAIPISAADVTLALTTGGNLATGIISTGASGSTAQYATLIISGTKTAARNLNVPASSRNYVINNSAAAGGFLLTVRGLTLPSTYTTGITLVDGEKAVISWNGTDYVKIASNTISNLTGTLPVANGGTGVTASTGTGSVVLSASPTFTGTPLAPTAAAKDATTQIATTAFADRLLSFLTSTTTGTAVLSDRGCLLPLTSGITIPSGVFAANDAFTIFNNSASSFSVTQGSGLTMYFAGPATTGTRTFAARGLCTVIFISSSVCVISGAGLT